MPLDQQANALLRQRNEMSPGEQREALTALAELGGEPEPVGGISNRTIPGPLGDIPIRVYTPEGTSPFPRFARGPGCLQATARAIE